jgi:hypothetical protein
MIQKKILISVENIIKNTNLDHTVKMNKLIIINMIMIYNQFKIRYLYLLR